ncbi:MAG: transglycosylase domain-containing protein, partial [Actinomycetota bacterium]|nr:transglycosylase domain-containing protein [Actinomycetota bacterium]
MSRRDRQRRRGRNRGSPLKRAFALSAVLTVSAAVIAALAVAGWVVNVAQSAPDLSSLRAQIPGAPSRIFAADGSLLGYTSSPTVRSWVSAKAIPRKLEQATIAIEDRRFYQ